MVKLKDRAKFAENALTYAYWWAGYVIAVADKYPLFKYPDERRLQLHTEVTIGNDKPINLVTDMWIEGNRVIVFLDFQDGLSKDQFSFDIPKIELFSVFDEDFVSLNLRHDIL